jgi:hypothetical protein
MHIFPPAWCLGFMVVTPSFMNLSITFSNQRFSSCNPTVDVGFVKLTSDRFCGNRVFKMNIQFCCHMRCSSSVIFLNNPSQCMMFSFCHWRFSPTVPACGCHLPMVHECLHNLRPDFAFLFVPSMCSVG